MTDSWKDFGSFAARLIEKDGLSGNSASSGPSQQDTKLSNQRNRAMHVNDVLKSKYLKASDLKDGDNVFTIKGFRKETFKKKDGGEEDKIVLSFKECSQELVLNKTNLKQVAKRLGGEIDEWLGKPITLFPTETDFSGEMVDCIRVRGRKGEMNDDIPF